MKPEILFHDYDLTATLRNQQEKINKTVSSVSTEILVRTELEDLITNLYEKLKVEPIVFSENEISVEQSETKVDVSRDPLRFISDRSRPFYIDGIQMSYYVPFSGDKMLFRCQPNRFTTMFPRAVINENELMFAYNVLNGNVAVTKPIFEKDFGDVKQWTGWVNEQVEEYNQNLPNLIQSKLTARLETLNASREQIQGLGYNVRSQKTPSVGATAQINQTPNTNTRTKRRTTKNTNRKALEYDVALSFAGENRSYVKQVANALKRANVNVFYDEFEEVNLWGTNLIDHLADVYARRSKFIVMFVSEHYGRKAWTNHERKFAQERQLNLQSDCILPVRFDDTKIPGLADSIGYLDLRQITPEKLAELIIKKLETS